MGLAARLKQQGAQVAALSAEREDIIALKEVSVGVLWMSILGAAETFISEVLFIPVL